MDPESSGKLLEPVAPGSVLIDADDRVIHLLEGADPCVYLGVGESGPDLVRVVHPMLRLELRAALCQARQTGQPVRVRSVPLGLPGGTQTVDLQVRPAPDLAPGFLLVIFEAHPTSSTQAPTPGRPGVGRTVEPVLCELEAELERLRFRQRATVEEYEASLEELKNSNEELQAINEQLRAATEEVGASQEELQSINEELSTVNQELKHKVDELAKANGDLQNLMAATDIATIFLDRALRIQRYTPAAVRLFSLIPSDLGRPLSDLSHRLEDDFIAAEARRVLASLDPHERETRSRDGRWYLVRLLPYRTPEDRISGVVLTFVDITERKELEQEVLAISGREQRRIGHDLHDDLYQRLGGIQLLSGILQQELASKGCPEARQAGRILAQAREALDRTRLMARGLAPVAPDGGGLALALQELAKDAAQLFGVHCEVQAQSPVALADPGAAIHLYRITQEAITNAVRHGHAKRVRIGLVETGDRFELEVRDHGCGFDPAPGATSGMGLRIMKYRAAMLGATLEVHSRPGRGTTVICTFSKRLSATQDSGGEQPRNHSSSAPITSDGS